MNWPNFLNWRKNTLLYTYRTNILVRLLTVSMKNCPTPQNPKMCDPILIALLKMRQSGRENATPSSGTSPFAPPPPLGLVHILSNNFTSIASLLSCSVESPDSSRALALYVRKKKNPG